MKAFQIYHLNLAFSSIPEKARPDVIARCYWPLLQLAEDLNIPIGVELTGWTLAQIQQADPKWVEHFKAMLHAGRCELIGSGWSQLIGPLVPAEVNRWNQKLGLEAYQSVLGLRPKLVLVNEMAWSTSLANLYAEAGYEGIIMDRDNVRLALNLGHQPIAAAPTHALGHHDLEIPILWSDSILFQRLQRVVHGDIPLSEYLDYVRFRTGGATQVLPIYCNDAEIFDYRPGRFTTEARLHPEGEWTRMRRVFDSLNQRIGLSWVSPSDALSLQNRDREKRARILSSAAHPIPVKKQAKYNVNRWSVTGRDDLWLNTACHRLHRRLCELGNESPDAWRSLCEFWASDLRTHITPDRWATTLTNLERFENALSAAAPKPSPSPDSPPFGSVEISQDEEDILWRFETANTRLELNTRRGLTLKSLAFRSQNFTPLIGTLPQGYFDSIDLGADYYSGGVLIEIPGERVRLTDLEWVKPEIERVGHELVIQGILPLAHGRLKKTLRLDLVSESLTLGYEFEDWERPLGIVRVGILTLLPETITLPLTLHCQNGSKEEERFVIDQEVAHGRAASTFVSSTSAIGATEGRVAMMDAHGFGFQALWDPAACAAIPLLEHVRTPGSHLTRLSFSLCELDDTARPGGHLLPFTFTLRPPSASEGNATRGS